jgi:hypothetical protein
VASYYYNMYYLMQPSKVYKLVVSTRLSHQTLSVDSTYNNHTNIMQVLYYYYFSY